jgi:hypothetical protein
MWPRYTFLSAGHDSVVVRVGFTSEGNGETVSLSGPHGEEVPIEPGATPLSTPGAYTLLVSRLSGSAPVPFSVGVYRFRSGVEAGGSTLVPGTVLEGELEYQGDVDTFTFEGQAGQRIVLQARELGGPTPNVWIIAELLPWRPPLFGELPLPHTNSFGSDLASTSSEPFRLDHTGVYQVQVKESDVSSTWTGRYQVRLRVIQ